MGYKIKDITKICNNCMHNGLDEEGNQSKVCDECHYSVEQKTMINFEQILDEDFYR